MKVLIIGSAPDSSRAQHWKMDLFDLVVVINNAWRITKKWDELIFPHDFSTENTPTVLLKHQKIITEEHFVPAQNLFGGLYMQALQWLSPPDTGPLQIINLVRFVFWVATCTTAKMSQPIFTGGVNQIHLETTSVLLP